MPFFQLLPLLPFPFSVKTCKVKKRNLSIKINQNHGLAKPDLRSTILFFYLLMTTEVASLISLMVSCGLLAITLTCKFDYFLLKSKVNR